MCAVINVGDTSANRGNGGNTGNGTDPPHRDNGGNTGNGTDPPNTGNSGNGGNGGNGGGGAVEPPSIINEQTGERVVIRLNEQEWERCREALRGAPLPFGSPQELLMCYHWLLKEDFKRQKQATVQLEARIKAAEDPPQEATSISPGRGNRGWLTSPNKNA